MKFRGKTETCHLAFPAIHERRAAKRAGVHFLFAILILCGVCAAKPQRIFGQRASAEYEVKAAYLYNFAKFVEWPAKAFPSDKSPIVLCVFGKDPFSGELETTVLGKTMEGRAFETRHTNRVEELHVCQMVFVSDGEAKHIAEILAVVKDAPVLLVGESPKFAEDGGEIGFVLQDGKVHFAVNVDAVERAHLRVSSKLLSLAKIVHDDGTDKEN